MGTREGMGRARARGRLMIYRQREREGSVERMGRRVGIALLLRRARLSLEMGREMGSSLVVCASMGKGSCFLFILRGRFIRKKG